MGLGRLRKECRMGINRPGRVGGLGMGMVTGLMVGRSVKRRWVGDSRLVKWSWFGDR